MKYIVTDCQMGLDERSSSNMPMHPPSCVLTCIIIRWCGGMIRSPRSESVLLVTHGLDPEGTKRATSLNVQLLCLRKDLHTVSIPRDIANDPSELCGRRSGMFTVVTLLVQPGWHVASRRFLASRVVNSEDRFYTPPPPPP